MINEPLLFTDEPASSAPPKRESPWQLLIVDDEPSVHEITRLALEELELDGRPLEFISTYSAAEARHTLAENPNIAVILLDVVMETDDAGLVLVDHIRRKLNNALVRIILRTGQPGQAPERQVILEHDINDYKEKTDLSSSKLFSTVVTALRGYRDLTALDKNRRGLEKIISASRSLYDLQSMETFVAGLLTQLESLMDLGESSFFSKSFGVLGRLSEDPLENQRIIAGTGEYADMAHRPVHEAVGPKELATIKQSLVQRKSLYQEDTVVVELQGSNGQDGLLYLSGRGQPLDEVDRNLLDIFTSNASMALNNLYLNQEIEYTQREILFTLGEIAEFRSRETGRHVARMSKTAGLIARKLDLGEDECNIVMLAASMHDLGKIAIPDAILSKPGKLTAEEWQLMKSHALLGYKLLKGSNRPLLRAAATIAHEHHEKWDGRGYPRGLAGHDIHLYGRIAALADVFDALGNKRCYKTAWSREEIIGYFEEQRGKHFDPVLVDLFLENADEFFAIREAYADQ
jgi:response regulator RpfG family c-di-GMP phosphodiesterase